MHEKELEINNWISKSDSTYLTDECPDGIREAVLRAGMDGSTWEIHAAIEALEAIRDGEIDPDDEETIYSWADSTTDIYNYSLRQWFAGDGWPWYQDYIEEVGDGSGDIHRDLMAAQCMAYERIAGEIVYAFNGWLEELQA